MSMQVISNELRTLERKVRTKGKLRRSSARGLLVVKRRTMTKKILRKLSLNRLNKGPSSDDGSIDLSWFLGISKYLGAVLNPSDTVAKLMEDHFQRSHLGDKGPMKKGRT